MPSSARISSAVSFNTQPPEGGWQVRTRQEYYQIEWPLRTRMYEYGVYADELLQGMFMPAFGMITNAG